MKFRQSPQAVMIQEAIAHQGRSLLFREICQVFKEIEGLPTNALGPDLLMKKGLNKVIQKHTGLNVPVHIDHSGMVNAWIYPPMIDANHALVAGSTSDRDNWWMLDWISQQSNKAFGRSDSIFGTVDRENSKVTGAFCNIECPMYLTRGMLTHKEATPEMVTSAVLHELGHVFTYFEFMGRITTFNGALQAASEAFFKCDNREDRLKVIRDVGDKFGVDADDRDVLMGSKNKDAFATVLARGYVIDRKSSLGSSIYDITLWESLSDQFSQRHGSGLDGVKMMDLLYRDSMHSSYQSNLTHIIFTLLKVVLFVCLTLFTFGVTLLILFVNPAERIYDEPKARMQRMRNDAVSGLKSARLSAEDKTRVVNDLKEMDAIIAELDDKRGLIELFYTACTPNGRRQFSQMRFQQEIELLVSNDLLVSSTRLSNLAKRLS